MNTRSPRSPTSSRTELPRHRRPVRVRGPWWYRFRWYLAAAALAIVCTGIAAGVATARSSSGNAASLLAAAESTAGGGPVDGIQCQTQEAVVYHIHAHLAVYVNNREQTIPAGIGITAPRQFVETPNGPFVASGGCFYWLHTHTADGIIHIESPVQRTYTLGNFFDIWQQPLSPNQVGPAGGVVTEYVNGQPFNGDPRSIPLTAHEQIQLDVNSNVPPQPFTFPEGL